MSTRTLTMPAIFPLGASAHALPAGAVAVAVFVWWAGAAGGYAPGAWYPGALLFLVLLATVARSRLLRGLPRPALWALITFGGFTVWSFLSIAWADAKGDAWDGANRTLLYLTVFALFALLPFKPAEGAVILGLFALATAVLGAWTFLEAVHADRATVFVEGRLSEPVGYANASAAIFLAAFWPAVFLASTRATPWPLRGALLAAAGILLQLAIMAQSRGSLVAGAVTALLYLALVPERARSLLSFAVIGVTTLASLEAVLGVYDADETGMRQALQEAELGLGLSTAFLLVAGTAIGLADRRPAQTTRRAGARSRLMALAAVALVVIVAGLTAAGSRFTDGPSSGRYDIWHVATLTFTSHLLLGVGADNFAHDYARERTRREEPLFPHSVELRTLSQTGLLGGALFAGFLAAVAATARRLVALDPARAGVAAAALVSSFYWLAHGSMDWLWELPALGAPAMAWLGLAVGMGLPADARSRSPRARRRPAVVAAAAAMACAAALSYALPALAAHRIERAVAGWRDDPPAALRELERARGLNVLSDRADVIAGALARRVGDRRRARRAFLRALERDAGNWYVHVELAVLDIEDGRRATALARLERARSLNPLEPVVPLVIRRAVGGEPVLRSLLEHVSRLTVPGPLGRHSIDCRPVLGLGAACAAGARA